MIDKTKLLYLEDFLALTAEARVEEVGEENGKVVVMLDATIFYPQGGGQPYDTGAIESGVGRFIVQDTRFTDGIVKHIGHFETGMFAVGEQVELSVDADRRALHSRLHSAGHVVDMAVAGPAVDTGQGISFPAGAVCGI
ncbi:MAG: alanine--tRNA ligase-related protein [Candidatus Sungiibacteriota bacterium]